MECSLAIFLLCYFWIFKTKTNVETESVHVFMMQF